MIGATILVLVAIGVLLVPDLRAEPWSWVFAGILLTGAALMLTVGRPRRTLRTARQVKFARWWGYTSHDGSGETDIREKRGE